MANHLKEKETTHIPCMVKGCEVLPFPLQPLSLLFLIGITAGVLLSVAAWAETLVDPTRPPAQINNVETVSQVASISSSGLQSILISKTQRAAIIDGKTIVLGQLHNGARLVEVNESNVVLVGPLGRRVLKLFPEVKMTQKGMPSQLPSVQADQNNNPPVKHKEQK